MNEFETNRIIRNSEGSNEWLCGSTRSTTILGFSSLYRQGTRQMTHRPFLFWREALFANRPATSVRSQRLVVPCLLFSLVPPAQRTYQWEHSCRNLFFGSLFLVLLLEFNWFQRKKNSRFCLMHGGETLFLYYGVFKQRIRIPASRQTEEETFFVNSHEVRRSDIPFSFSKKTAKISFTIISHTFTSFVPHRFAAVYRKNFLRFHTKREPSHSVLRLEESEELQSYVVGRIVLYSFLYTRTLLLAQKSIIEPTAHKSNNVGIRKVEDNRQPSTLYSSVNKIF